MGNAAARDAKRILAGQRRNAVIAGRNAGKTLQQMADELGISRRRCSQIVQEVLDDLSDESLDLGKEYIRLELARIEKDEKRAEAMYARRLRIFESRAPDGSERVAEDKDARIMFEALSQMRACRQERAKYLGLYAPDRKEVTGKGGGAISVTLADIDEALGAADTNGSGGDESDGSGGAD